MEVSQVEGLDAPAIMRIGAARLTAGLDWMPRLDLDAHREIFGPLPRLSIEELISIAEQVDLRGQGGAAFPFARKLRAVVQSAEASERFDAVYVGLFKCNLRRIADYPQLSRCLGELRSWPGVADTIDMFHIKHHYYESLKFINPTGIVPVGPEVGDMRRARGAPMSRRCGRAR